MDKAFVKSVSDKLGYTLLGEYAKGVAESKGYIPKTYPSEELGRIIANDKFVPSGESALVDIKRFDTPAISCGVLSNLITTCNRKIQTFAEKAEIVLGPGKFDQKEKLINDFVKELQEASTPIARAEGADDDELKQDIRILLREGKEEFEKRVEATEKEKQEEESEVTTDTEGEQVGQDPTEDTEGTESFEGADDYESGDDDDYSDDTGSEEDESSEDDVDDSDAPLDDDSDDSSDAGDEIPDGNLDDEDSQFDDDEDDSDDDEEDEEKDPAKLGESKPFTLSPSAIAELEIYNSQKSYAEEQKFFHKGFGEFSSLPMGDLKLLKDKLMKAEEDNFRAIGESFDPSQMNSNALMAAHKSFVNTTASVLCFQRKLNLL